MIHLSAASLPSAKPRRARSNPWGYLFALPYVLHFLIFTAYPLGFALYLTLHRWDIVGTDRRAVARSVVGRFRHQSARSLTVEWYRRPHQSVGW